MDNVITTWPWPTVMECCATLPKCTPWQNDLGDCFSCRRVDQPLVFTRMIVNIPRLYRILLFICDSVWMDTAITTCPWPLVIECFPALPKLIFFRILFYQMRRCVNGHRNYHLPMAYRHGVLRCTTQIYPPAKGSGKLFAWRRNNQSKHCKFYSSAV